MVRINIINPKYLADQHLIAEYNEILMLLGYVKRYPALDIVKIPSDYVLGKGHMLFFKNKLKYLDKRHDRIKQEMKKRGFATNKRINLSLFPLELVNDWKHTEKDVRKITKRIEEKIRKKPEYYRYYGEHKKPGFFIDLIRKAE